MSSDDSGDPLVGVSVSVKGSNTGTLSGDNGAYSVSVDGSGTLVFSYLGYETQEVNVEGRSAIDVVLTSGSLTTDEVVITALGVARDKKALGYSVTEVAGEELTEAREVNVVNRFLEK